MKLAEVSKLKLKHSFGYWEVDTDYSDPISNYLVYGFSPGSFFTSVLANNFVDAMAYSHPANSIPALKKLSGWIVNEMPREAWGSYEAVDNWLRKTTDERRMVLEYYGLIYTEVDETFVTLKEA